jgi:hypothetical protein
MVRLGGAVTLEGYRGRGVYTSLVARRLEDARDRGMTAAVIQSASVSSEPICRGLGFRQVCSMAGYGWVPAGERESLAKLADRWTVS